MSGSAGKGFGGNSGGGWGPKNEPPKPSKQFGGTSTPVVAPPVVPTPTPINLPKVVREANTSKLGLGSEVPLQSGEELANLFGNIFGYDNIYKILTDATEAKYGSWDAQTRQTRDQYLTDMANQQQGVMENSRNIRQQAVRTGLSKGSNVASEVMQQMAAQQQSAGVQQEYRGALNAISNEKASQQGMDIYSAMAQQNALASEMGGLAVNNRANSVQELAARLSYNAQIDSNNATRGATAAQERAAQSQLQASMGFFNSLVAMGIPDAYAWTIATAQDPGKELGNYEEKNPKAPSPKNTTPANWQQRLARSFGIGDPPSWE